MKRILCAAMAAFTLLIVPCVMPMNGGEFRDPASFLINPAQAQPAPPTTQNTVTTTGPVSSTTTIETGTLGGEALKWVAAVFGGSVGMALTAFLVKLLRNAGIQASDAMRARLQEIIVNGLNFAAKTAATDLAGRGQIAVKNAVVGEAVKYVQAHGAETLQQLGLDPNSNKAVDAIKARIETAIADPSQPTPAVLSPPAAPLPAAAAAKSFDPNRTGL